MKEYLNFKGIILPHKDLIEGDARLEKEVEIMYGLKWKLINDEITINEFTC